MRVASWNIMQGGGGKYLGRKIGFWDAILEVQAELGNRPTIVTGDLNTERHYRDENGAKLSGADRFEAMLERGWVDAFRSLS